MNEEIQEILEEIKNQIETLNPNNKKLIREVRKRLTILLVEINYLGEEGW